MKNLIVLLLLVMAFMGNAQVKTNPALPVANKALTVTFNSAEDSRLGLFTGDLYAHTGVGLKDKGNWQKVIGNWGQNNTQPKLTNLGNGIYELVISPDINTFYKVAAGEIVINLSFVFRSADGSKQSGDIFIDVYQPGLGIGIQFPQHQAILNLNQAYTFEATSTSDANLSINIDNTIIAQKIGSTISVSYTFTKEGGFNVIASAEKDGETASDTAFVYIKGNVMEEPLPLNARKGIEYLSDNSVRLVLWAPEKEYVYVLSELSNWLPNNNFLMKKNGDYFWIELQNLTAGKEYPFQYYIDGNVKVADPYTEQISDPWNDSYISDATYPNLIPYPKNKLEGIASVFQTGQQPYNWIAPNVEMPSNEEMVIYELLVRDFTSDHTFEAVREKLDYLQDLRVNVLELMPVNEFESNKSWGYNPSFYFAVDKYYGHRTELKKLIDECHQRGIAVVIDMVLNHSYGQSPMVRMYSNGSTVAANNPWYNVTSNFQNPDAQWGYDFNHESQATKEFVDSVNSYWINEYKVDGFRFDFTKGFSNTVYPPSSWGSDYDAGRIANLKRMSDQIWKQNPNALVICEHLSDNKEEKELADYGLMLWGNINHNYGEAAMGYVSGTKSDLSWGHYAHRGWSKPNLVSYQESHDEERLIYKCLTWGNAVGEYSTKNLNTAIDRIKLNSVFHLPLPGPKMIWQFGELGYDISIDQNGRVGEKPVKWEYFEEGKRKELFRTMASLNYLKQNYEEFSTSDISYSLVKDIKTYMLNHNNEHVVAIGNFNVEAKSVSVEFPKTGKWYNYFSQESIDITSGTMTFNLEAGEYLLLSTRKFDMPTYQTKVEVEETRILKSAAIYPNPTFGVVHLKEFGEVLDIELYNSAGQICFSERNQKTIDIGALKSGLYIYRIKTKTAIYNGRIIKF